MITDEMMKEAAHEVMLAWLAQVDREAEEEHRQALTMPPELTPSPNGRECLGNGHWPGYECQCPDCDSYEQCFPDLEGHKAT